MPPIAPSATKVHIDSPGMRQGGRELLSLALMDARNQTLHLMAQFDEAVQAKDLPAPQTAPLRHALWEMGHLGWFQEWWIGRNMQRHLGPQCDGAAARLASIEPQADRWWNPALAPQDGLWPLEFPEPGNIRAYLLDTLESTLELLERTADEDVPLYFYRLALFHEDLHAEAFVASAQALGLALKLPTPGAMAQREPVLMPAAHWRLGLQGVGGFAFDNELESLEVAVPEFEIDAQPVCWSQFVEFVDDGGYDQPAFWLPQGWQWLQQKAGAEGRRGPRYVEQIGAASGAVMQTRFGRTMRMLGGQPVMHVSWWEADAWCRWAQRRLPSEVEWEYAAQEAARRGFRWGDVWEWSGTTLRPYPGFAAGPWREYSEPWFGRAKVLRGASFATRARLKHFKFRGFALPEADEGFAGFRSCAL